MLRSNRFAWVLALVVGSSLVACGGGSSKKDTKKPAATKTTKKKKPTTAKKETEEDRAKKRDAAAEELVASGSTCLPTSLKDPSSKLTLELGAVGSEAIVCAMDSDSDRLLGAAGCWTIDLSSSGLVFRDRNAIPGRGYPAGVNNGCVRGYCAPKEQELGDKAMIAWSLDGKQTAVLAGEHVHLFDAESKDLSKSIALHDSTHGDKALPGEATGLWFVGDTLFLQGGEAGKASIWMYKTDGSAVGPLLGLGKGNPPVEMAHGSFSVLDKDRVAVAERGFSTLTIFEVGTGKRSKLVRKVSAGPCRSAQVESFFSAEPGEIPAKCLTHLKKSYDAFTHTTMVAGSKNFLGALGADRVGELAVIDSKNLSEKRSIKLPWCEAGAGAEPAAKGMVESSDDAAGASITEDPDSGGQSKKKEK